MEVAFYLAGEITQVLDAIPCVRCASGNVYPKTCHRGMLQVGILLLYTSETTYKMQFPDKQLLSTWSSKKEICFRLFSCLAPCQKCKITKQLMAPRSRCPGSVDNPTNKPDLAYCALILTMILLKQHRTSPARHLPCYAATQFDQKIVNKYFPPNVFAKVKVHALRDCGWQIGFD